MVPREQMVGVRVSIRGGDVNADHSHILESRVLVSAVDRLGLTDATLVDVAVDELGAVEVSARDSRWRNVVISRGRVGSFDAARAEWDGVTLRGLRIDYLSLASAAVSDVVIADCVIGTLDVPEASLERVQFQDSRADEVDTRGLRAKDLDLRGLEVLSFTDVRGLAGATLSERQIESHAMAFADALGVVCRE